MSFGFLLRRSFHCLSPALLLPSAAQHLPRVGVVRALNSKSFVVNEGANRTLNFREIPGDKQPTVVFVPGLHSYAQMNGTMGKCILRYCDVNHMPCITYDHECSGESKGDLTKVLFSHWVEDAIKVIENLTEGPVLLVSLSMGGWLSLVASTRLQERIYGLVLFAPAINYVYPYYQFHRGQLPEDARRRLDAGDPHVFSHAFGDALLKKDFAEDSRQYEIDFTKSIDISCPVRIIHGLQDSEVKPEQSLELCKNLKSKDVDLIYRKNCPHQAVNLQDIELILNTMDRLIKDNPVRKK
jgi:pimeloyl-ACP methyl ester carboxylesterase